MIQVSRHYKFSRLVIGALSAVFALGSANSAFGQTVSSVSFRFPAIFGGGKVMGTVSLSSASSSPVTVSLSSSDPSLTVPETVTIPANALSQTFVASTSDVAQPVKALVTASQGGSSASSTLLVDVVNWSSENANDKNTGLSKTLGPRVSENAQLLAVAPSNVGPNHTSNIVALPGSRGVMVTSYDATPNAARHAYSYVSRNGWGSRVSIFDWFGYSVTDAAVNSMYAYDNGPRDPSMYTAECVNQFLSINKFEQPFVLNNQTATTSFMAIQNTYLGVAPATTFTPEFQRSDSSDGTFADGISGNLLSHSDGSFEYAMWQFQEGDAGDYYPYVFSQTESTSQGASGILFAEDGSGPFNFSTNSSGVDEFLQPFDSYNPPYNLDFGIYRSFVTIYDLAPYSPALGKVDEAFTTGYNSVSCVSSAATVLWTTPSLGTILGAVKTGPDDTVYVSYSDSSNLDWTAALSPVDGSIKWKTQVNGAVGCVDSAGTCYVLGDHGLLSIVNSSGVNIASNIIDPTDIEEPVLASDGKLYLLGSQRQKLYVIAPPALAQISSSNNNLSAGERATVTIKLNEKVPGDGMTLQLSTDQPGLLQIPQTVRVQGNATSVIFTVIAGSPKTSGKATITAVIQGSCASTENATLSLPLNVAGTGVGPTN